MKKLVCICLLALSLLVGCSDSKPPENPLVQSVLQGTGCNDSDPICVASIIIEKGVMLKTSETLKYRCKDDSLANGFLMLDEKKAVQDYKERQGIDYHGQAIMDFSDLEYTCLEKTETTAKIKVSGEIRSGFKDTEIKVISNLDTVFELKKSNDTWLYCSSKPESRPPENPPVESADQITGCDDSDPICVASILVEKGAMLKNKETIKYRCKENDWVTDLMLLADQKAIEIFKKDGINYHGQAIMDFSDLKYTCLEKTETTAKVKVSGKVKTEIKNTEIISITDFEEVYEFIKGDDSWLFCPTIDINKILNVD